MNYCQYCSAEVSGNGTVCDKHKQQLCDWVDEHPSVVSAAHGLSDGPGTQQVHFCKPDPLKECRLAAKKGEGGMDAATKKMMAGQIAALKAQEPTREKIDYQVDGHAMYGVKT